MDPDRLRTWQSIFRDFVIVAVAAFMLVHETLVAEAPNAYIIGAGLTLLGAPAAIRADQQRRRVRENGHDDDRWSHLP